MAESHDESPASAVAEAIQNLGSRLAPLQASIHQYARGMGYYKTLDASSGDAAARAHAVATLLALIHSEVSEVLMEVRYEATELDPADPEGPLAQELADIAFRVLDLSEFLGVDLGFALSRKFSDALNRGVLQQRHF